MEVEIRPFDGSVRDYVDAAFLAFSEHVSDADAEPITRLMEPDRMLAAYDGDRPVGTAAALSFELTVPGGSLPAAGVTVVGVHATHRRQGILRRMMERQLADVAERGEPIAVLWASEAGIYQRFGYGLASVHAGIKVDRQHNAFRRPYERSGEIRFVSEGDAKAIFPSVYDAARPSRIGFFNRTEAYWDTWIFAFPDAARHGRGDPFHVVHATDGVDDGYVRYAMRSGERTELSVMDMVSANPAAQIDLWRFLLDVDLVSRVEAWNVAVDDPLRLTVAEPRRLGMELADGLWLRIIDVPSALAGRRYRSDGRLVLELTDELLPDNQGTWALEASGGLGSVTATTDAAELALDTTDLAAAYLGGNSFAQLAAARRVRELMPGTVERGDLMFGTDHAPWVPSIF